MYQYFSEIYGFENTGVFDRRDCQAGNDRFFTIGNGAVWFLTTLFLIEVLFYCLRGKHENIIFIVTGIILGSIPFFVLQNGNLRGIITRKTMVGYAFFHRRILFRKIYNAKNKNQLCGCDNSGGSRIYDVEKTKLQNELF